MKKLCFVVVAFCGMGLFAMEPDSPEACKSLLKRSKSITDDLAALELAPRVAFDVVPNCPANAAASNAPKLQITIDAIRDTIEPLSPSSAILGFSCATPTPAHDFSPLSSPAAGTSKPGVCFVIAHRKTVRGKDRRFLVMLPNLRLPSPAADAEHFESIFCEDSSKK